VLRRAGEALSREFVSVSEPRFAITDAMPAPQPEVWRGQLDQARPGGALLEHLSVGDAEVVLETSVPVRPLLFQPEIGRRIYLDLAGARSGPVPRELDGRGLIGGVRVSQIAQDPALVRVVVDLARNATHRLDVQGNRIVLAFAAACAGDGSDAEGRECP
jgi:hypothetical protein